MGSRIVLSLIVLFALSSTAYPKTQSPDAVVRAFYVYSTARSSTFGSRHIALRKRWYTPQLYRAFLDQLAKDQKHLKEFPTDKPFFGDGLDFQPVDEPCEALGHKYHRSRRVGRAKIAGSRAVVDVTFSYPRSCTNGPAPIVYKVVLRRIGGSWLIDDWRYPEGSTLAEEMRAFKY